MSMPKTTKLNVEGLEGREMMSASSAVFNAGTVTIRTDGTATNVTVTSNGAAGSIQVSDDDTGMAWN